MAIAYLEVDVSSIHLVKQLLVLTAYLYSYWVVYSYLHNWNVCMKHNCYKDKWNWAVNNTPINDKWVYLSKRIDGIVHMRNLTGWTLKNNGCWNNVSGCQTEKKNEKKSKCQSQQVCSGWLPADLDVCCKVFWKIPFTYKNPLDWIILQYIILCYSI